MMLVSLIAAVSLGAALQPTQPDHERTWLMFFMRGNPDAKSGENPMEGHLGNMKKQASLGRLLAAGPLQDPTKERRGITVVVGHDEKEIKSFFASDPFVKSGAMSVSVWPWKVDRSKFSPVVDEKAITEYQIVFVRRGKGMQPQTAEMERQHRETMSSAVKHFGPGIWGPVTGMDKVFEVMIVPGKDAEGIRAHFKGDPLVAKAIYELEIVDLWMSKGIFKP